AIPVEDYRRGAPFLRGWQIGRAVARVDHTDRGVSDRRAQNEPVADGQEDRATRTAAWDSPTRAGLPARFVTTDHRGDLFPQGQTFLSFARGQVLRRARFAQPGQVGLGPPKRQHLLRQVTGEFAGLVPRPLPA